MKWLVVDDTSLYRKILNDVLSTFPEVTEIQTAPNGSVALRKAMAFRPDAITLDYEMPDMNGLEVLHKLQKLGIKSEYIMISAHTPQGAAIAIDAMDLGAIDAIAKPEGRNIEQNIQSLKSQLIPIMAAVKTRLTINGAKFQAQSAPQKQQLQQLQNYAKIHTVAGKSKRPKIIAIGASTGGPKALTTVLTQLPQSLDVPVVITIHMPRAFTGQLADTLNKKCEVNVVEAQNGMKLEKGVVHIAPGGEQMRVAPGSIVGTHIIELTDDPPEHNCKPSVDYLFRSVAKEYGAAAIGVILTGMGYDGVAGMKLMKLQGASTIAQNEETCVVFGMPAKAIEDGIVDHIMPIDTLHTKILKVMNGQ
ncbi:MAG: chemotaxis-specific protein-glutamate methyltransferase CheB [Deltaproteobacteria bacterium]|nr:chemotaxis-specific protein-glutamate methyltransferase CheB [Deltaproteobacteria bacterium]MBN2674200.1 chemotaxis-specific protein-glutamate methyltransferase CheB [Deltaproteobacteria bacterium]